MTREIEYFITSLASKLTSRLKDEDLGSTIFWIDSIESGNTKCSSLSTSSLRLDDDIFTSKGKRDDGRLDFCRSMVAEISKCLKDLWAKRKGRKRHKKMDKLTKNAREE